MSATPPNGGRPTRGLGLVLGAGIGSALLALLFLSAVNGPTEEGVRCERGGAAPARCEVLRSRLLGLIGNSAFPIPQSQISGAKTICGSAAVGRGGTSCRVYLQVEGRGGYLVLSYKLESRAAQAAGRINAYLADPSSTVLEIRESVDEVLLLRLGVPAVLIALLLALRAWRSRRRRATAAP